MASQDFPSTASLIGVVQDFEGSDTNMAKQWFPVEQTLGNTYEFDILYGNRTKADYRLPDAVAGTQKLTRKVRKRVVLPTLREKKMLKESTLRWLDGAGKHIPERAMVEIAKEMADLDDIIERTHEYARWQLLTTGKITLSAEYNSEVYDFTLGTEATTGTTWATAASSDPIGDLLDWKKLVEQASGRPATQVIMGSSHVKSIFEATSAQLLLGESTKDKYRATGKVDQLVDMDVIIQDDGYLNASDAFKYYLSTDGAATDMVIIKTDGKVGETVEGGVVDSKAPDAHVGKFAKSWEEEDPTGRWVLEAHTCLPGITNPNRVGAFKTTQAA